MKDLFVRIKNWFVNRWQRIRVAVTGFWYRITQGPAWVRIRPWAKNIGGLLLVGLALLGTILFIRSQGNNTSDEKNPEISQVYEPSIGTPLPPDVQPENASRPQVNGDATATPEPSAPTPPPAAPTSGVNLNEPLVAPRSGVSQNAPVEYSNSSFRFAATLPAGTTAEEKSDAVTFTSATRVHLYTVNITRRNSETLQSIEAQLKNSPSVKELTSTTFNGLAALRFTSPDVGGTGIVFIHHGFIYYLLGDYQHFHTFKTM